MKDSYNVVGDHILISNYVKYDRLEYLINNEFQNSNANHIILYIDMYSMIKSIYKLDPSQFIDWYSIASCVINACAHYRNFFWTRYRVTCEIWVVFSVMEESIKEARSFYPNYSNIFTAENNPAMDKMISDNIEILKLLCQYIPDVQFIHSTFEPGIVFGAIMQKRSISPTATIPNIIISKDPWNLQVVSNMKDTYMIRPIKKNGIDLSVIIDKNNVLEYYTNIRKIEGADVSKIDCSYLSFIIAATRFPERGIKSLHNLGSVIRYLNNAIEDPMAPMMKTFMYSTSDSLCDILMAHSVCKLKKFEINLRLDAIGFQNCLYRYYISPYCDDINMINLFDPNSVKLINEKYFSKIPLDLMSL